MTQIIAEINKELDDRQQIKFTNESKLIPKMVFENQTNAHFNANTIYLSQHKD